MKTKKIFALALAMLMSISLFAGCAQEETTTTSTTPAVMTDEEADTIVEVPVVTVPYTSTTYDLGVASTTDAGAESDQIAFTFDGGSVAADAYAYGLSQAYYTLETEYQAGLQTGELAITYDKVANYDAAKENAIEYVLQIVAIDLILGENEYQMTETLEQSIISDIAYAEEEMGTETFEGTLDIMGISREGFENEQMRVYAFEESVTDIYGKSDEELYESYENEYFKTQHILVSFEFDDTGAVTDEARATALAKAEDILAEVNAGEKTFDELMAEYNEDPGQPASGYAFKEGYMLEDFEVVAMELAEGEVSDLVETSYGIHIIKAVPSSVENFEENLTNIDYIEYYINAAIAEEALYARMDEIRETLVETELFATIDGSNYTDYYITD